MREPSKEQIKERAKFLREVLRDKHKIDLPHGHALEVLAKVFGYKDWNTASAISAEVSGEKSVTGKEVAYTNNVKPIAAKLSTAGELAYFFASFPGETKVVVNEYQAAPDRNNPNSISDYLAGTMTSVCSLTYDSEIQNGAELCLELNTEAERICQLQNFGKSSTQSFELTKAGRTQRRIKYLDIFKSSIWNPMGQSDKKS